MKRKILQSQFWTQNNSADLIPSNIFEVSGEEEINGFQSSEGVHVENFIPDSVEVEGDVHSDPISYNDEVYRMTFSQI